MLHSTLRALWLLLAVGGAISWPSNRFRIPNGHRVLCAPGVPDCAGVEAGTVCSAIGHAKCAGGTPAWNRFGLDFRRLGSRWSKELCAIDSDGDGASNGAELGDPCCVYDYDDPATYDLIDTTGPVSHPGSNKSVVPDYVRFPDPKCKPRPVEWATIRTNMQTTEEYDPSFFLKGEEQLVKRFTMQRFEIPVDMKSAKPDTVYEWVSWNWDGCTDKDCYLVGIEVDSRFGFCAQCPRFLSVPSLAPLGKSRFRVFCRWSSTTRRCRITGRSAPAIRRRSRTPS